VGERGGVLVAGSRIMKGYRRKPAQTAEVAVVGVPSAQWGESPYTVVVLRPGAHVSEGGLISWTRDRLTHFKCPVGVTFAPSLARTASGKLQKQAIRSSLGSLLLPRPARRLAASAPHGPRPCMLAPFQAPASAPLLAVPGL
jgi:non-ribosomal peptide synthetase component E (peptide arylation enzyme)